MALSQSQQLDGNGNLIRAMTWDAQNHQTTVPQSGPGVADSGNPNVFYAPFWAAPVDGQKVSYSVAINGLVPAASATDIFTITGSATKVVRITRLEISGIATTILDTTIRLAMRSGGTQSAGTALTTIVAHDSSDPAATAAIATYTANPASLGTLVGYLRSSKLLFNLAAPTAGSESGRLLEDFGDRPTRAIVLRNATQLLAVNLAGVTVAGGSIDISVEWTEE